jgi:hypothetical protein
MIQHSLAHFVLRAASASDWAPCEQHDRKAAELANHAELTLTGDSYRTRQRRQLLAKASRAANDWLARRPEALHANSWGREGKRRASVRNSRAAVLA